MEDAKNSGAQERLDTFVADVKRKVRVVFFDDCPWYVGVDVCKILGLAPSPSNRTYQSRFMSLTPFDKMTLPENLGGQGHKRVLVNESGLRKLVSHSLLSPQERGRYAKQLRKRHAQSPAQPSLSAC